MNRQAVDALATSNDPWVLADAAKALARGADPAEHAALARALGDRRFLESVDTKQDYDGSSLHLRLAGVLKLLGENPNPVARVTLAAAARSTVFEDHPSRVGLLIDAFALIRPAPPEAVAFWNKYSQPEDGFVNRTMRALSTNGSAPAVGLFERKLAEPQFEDEDVEWWLLRYALPLRNDPVFLEAARRWLGGTLRPSQRPVLVAALFDYQPKVWYSPHDVPPRPDLLGASAPALQSMDALATAALAMQLEPGLEAKVKSAQQQIRERLKR